MSNLCKCKKRLTVYYAHPMYLYNTPQEKRDVELLTKLGFDVINPNSAQYRDEYQIEIDAGRHNMDYWTTLASKCDVITFRAMPEGKILSGVWAELMANIDMPMFELPRMIEQRDIGSVKATRQYLSEIGER